MHLTKHILFSAAAARVYGLPAGPLSVRQQPCDRRVPATQSAVSSSTGTLSSHVQTALPTVPVIVSVSDYVTLDLGFDSGGDWTHYPPSSQWKPFEQLFQGLRPTMLATKTTPGAVDRIRLSILKHAVTYCLDPRLILAIIMAESRGNVGQGAAVDTQPTPGLMQAWHCIAYPGAYDATQEQIDAMVDCGTQHFKSDMDLNAGGSYEQQVYQAMRSYNSGPRNVNKANLDDVGTNGAWFYVHEIGDYLTGAKTD